MDRRTFAAFLGATLVTPKALRQATPAAPAHTDRPDPIDLGNGITLIDYRLHSGDRAAVIGEIRNDTDRMIDAPVVSLTYPRGDQDGGFAWASPLRPVIEAGGSVAIFGTVPDNTATNELLTAATFALCSPAEPGIYTEKEQALTLILEIGEELIDEGVYRCDGAVTNAGSVDVADTMVRGIVRDADGRVAGTTSSPFTNKLGVGVTLPWRMWAGGDLRNKANPMVLITGTDYTVEHFAGTRGPVASPGCTFGLPWE